MRVPVNGQRLRVEVAIRGLDGRTFCKYAKISPATLSHAMNGKQINPQTLRAVATALAQLPVIDGLEGLVDFESQAA